MIEHRLTQTITVSRKTTSGRNTIGSPTEVYTPRTETVPGLIRQLSASEQTQGGRRASKSTHRLYTMIIDLIDTDRVLCDGITYEVVGPPNKLQNMGRFMQTDLEVIK